MSFPHVSFVLEVIGACLLLVMIIYAIQLNRRLSGLQADKAYLQKLIMGFNEATERAEASIGRLRLAALEANDALQTNTKIAKDLRNDLSFLIDRAESMADRLESSIASGRTESAFPGRPESVFPDRAESAVPNRTAEISAFRPVRGGKDTSAASHTKAALSRALAGIR
jgi:Domain of unknown function (DUF6468)